MKESITKFDLEAAFKALDSIDTPEVDGGVKANRAPLTEIFSRKSKLDLLMEEYYDVNSETELDDAQKAREAEVAAAKLARIEKIVDLDAKSPDELLTSYVGKYIIQCPQCMTLFYKNKEDVEESEDDPTTVNVNEVCQHCGNESGYTLVGKVGAADTEESDEAMSFTDDETDESAAAEEATEEGIEPEETDEAGNEDDLEDFDLEELDLDIEDDESDAAEESFNTGTGNEVLAEAANKNAWRESIDSKMLSYLSDSNIITESVGETDDLDVSADEFEQLINSAEFQKPVSDRAARAMMSAFDEGVEHEAEEPSDVLEEGGLGTLGKTLFKKAKQAGSNIKNKISMAIDKFAENAQTREEKADWILANACKDYDQLKVSPKGDFVPEESNKRFKTFIIIGYKNKYSNGKVITMMPSYNNKDIVMGMKRPEVKKSYKDADDIAKGWSMRTGNGPAFIFLAESPDDDNAAFLCGYFQGELENDQLENYFKKVKNDLAGSKGLEKMTNQDGDDEDASPVDPVDTEEE